MVKNIAISAVLGLMLFGCQTTTKDSGYVPTASQADISRAKVVFRNEELVDVTDDGFLVFTEGLEVKQYWKTSAIRKAGYRIACEDLGDFIEAGFVVQILFKGQGGINDFYDANRCDQDAVNHL